ncbi:glycosyltransferase family 4 protein [Mucilaginibacter sp. UR6-11]|uniref:glycosyltransferase family 4 protein n=1 Tax=Mucilaginibacter sp. UR6-11 TaxID=1435644 RepID=UPI001E3AA45A|nr:glycosyltransferase family 4 protein [Mucilaginibacter sp. UR6-11]MCC8425261.1 glycosyltransferase family 4 protein [Mucilaginibacter sp. UR6-11]
MKISLINTSDAGGGAPAACLRLLKALTGQNVDARLLVQYKKTGDEHVTAIVNSFVTKLKAQLDFLRERIPFILFHEKDKSVRFAFSTANVGTDIVKNPLVAGADIIHLHWTNSGFLSIADLKRLVDTGKPIVWTLHDMWTFTGGCHYSGTCNHFINECGNCPFLRDAGDNDISHSGWLRKAALYAGAKNITFVTCSRWLAGVAKQSSLLKDFRIESIPNPIDINTFLPKDKAAARRQRDIDPSAKIILFGAANINDRRKGISYLVEALHILKAGYPQSEKTEIVIFGKNNHFDVSRLPFKVHELNLIRSQDELADIYSMADVFVTPSLEDNLPNTIMEAMACGTPVVAFNTGGIPEMVDHQQNGYLAGFKSATDMAKGLHEILNAVNAAELSAGARQKVLDNYTNENVAGQYINLYQSIFNK